MSEEKRGSSVRPSTAIISHGFDPKLSVGSARPAVFRASTYVFSSPESAERAFLVGLGKEQPREKEDVELIYCRLSHPNSEILETHLVSLEPGAQGAAVFNSGLAAISTVLFTFCNPGHSFVVSNPIYGGTYHLIHELFSNLNMHGMGVLGCDTQAMVQKIRDTSNLDLIFIETPANPTLCMVDLASVVEAAKKHPDKPLVVVDNTFMGPTFQHPLSLGADIVMYSATKFLSGFSDLLGGCVMAKSKEHIAKIKGLRTILGNILQPDQCWLLDSRLPTVQIRMNRQSKNAQRIAEKLVGHPKLKEVIYPSLFTDPQQKQIRDAQCSFPGALFSFRIKGGKPQAFDFIRNLKLIHNAVSLGGMETLVCHPATTTHSEMSKEDLDRYKVGEDLVRISVGIEDWRDLFDDIHQALERLKG